MFDVVVEIADRTPTRLIRDADLTSQTVRPGADRSFFPRVSRVLFAIDRIEARCTTKAPKFVSPPLPPKQHVARLVDDRCIFQFR